MKHLTLGLLLGAVAMAGCETMQSNTVQGGAVGSAVGAATGAVVGHRYGETGAGMAIGAGLGSVAGTVAGSALTVPPKAPPQPGVVPVAAPLTKFCPVGGEAYPETFRYCPLHGAELRAKDASSGTP